LQSLFSGSLQIQIVNVCHVSFQEEIQTALKFLEKKLKDFSKVKLTCEKIADHIDVQYSRC